VPPSNGLAASDPTWNATELDAPSTRPLRAFNHCELTVKTDELDTRRPTPDTLLPLPACRQRHPQITEKRLAGWGTAWRCSLRIAERN
jgi:hypothetical protein